MDPTSGLDNDSAASASFGAASSRLSRTRKAHPEDDQSTMVPAVVSRNYQAIAQRGYMSKFYVEVDAQSQIGQPPADAANTRIVISLPISSPKPSDISTPKEARAVAITPLSQGVLPSQALRDTGGNISLGLPEPGERKENNELSLHQVDPRERNATRPRTQQVDPAASFQPSAKPPTHSPPPLKQPSASASPLPPPPAAVLAKMASSRARGARLYEPQVPSRGIPFESPHPSGGDRGKAPLEEQSRMVSSVTPPGVPLPPDDRAAVATGPPSQPQPGAKNPNKNMLKHGGLDRSPGMTTSMSHSSGDIINLINLNRTMFQQEPLAESESVDTGESVTASWQPESSEDVSVESSDSGGRGDYRVGVAPRLEPPRSIRPRPAASGSGGRPPQRNLRVNREQVEEDPCCCCCDCQ